MSSPIAPETRPPQQAPASETRAPQLAAAVAVVLAVLALALVADRFLAHGTTVTWRSPEHARVVVARTLEHRASFPTVHRALSRYAQHWDFARFGVPPAVPRLDALVEADLTIPAGETRALDVRSANTTDVQVDGAAYEAAQLAPGRHRLSVHWTGSLERAASLELRWYARFDEPTPIPASALTPLGAGDPLRLYVWLLASLVALGAAVLTYRALRPGELLPSRGTLRARLTLLASLIVALGLFARLWDYDVVPDLRDNGDELFATWNGWQLLEDGTTRGWSIWPQEYGDLVHIEELRYFGQPWHIITPYFEHPPLMHLLVGAAAHLGGAREYTWARLSHTRLVPIGLSALVIVLLVLIGRRLFGKGPATYLGALLWAVLPMIVVQSRVIKEEEALVPLMLLSVWLALRWQQDGHKRRDLVLAAVAIGLAPLAKVTGAALIPALAVVIAPHARRRELLVFIGVACGVALLLPLYGAMDWTAFVWTTAKQATGRPMHWNLFPRFFDDPLINHSLIGRGWLLFLWLGFLGAMLHPSRSIARPTLAVPLIVYMLGMGISSGNWTFGWYNLPLYPLLCLGAGRFLADLWDRPDLLRGTLLIVLPVMYALNFTLPVEWSMQPEAWPVMRRWVTAFCAVSLVPFALAQAWPRITPFRSLARGFVAVAITLLVVLCLRFAVNFESIVDEYSNYDRREYFDR